MQFENDDPQILKLWNCECVGRRVSDYWLCHLLDLAQLQEFKSAHLMFWFIFLVFFSVQELHRFRGLRGLPIPGLSRSVSEDQCLAGCPANPVRGRTSWEADFLEKNPSCGRRNMWYILFWYLPSLKFLYCYATCSIPTHISSKITMTPFSSLSSYLSRPHSQGSSTLLKQLISREGQGQFCIIVQSII